MTYFVGKTGKLQVNNNNNCVISQQVEGMKPIM